MKRIILAVTIICVLSQIINGGIIKVEDKEFVECGYPNPAKYEDCSVADLNNEMRCCYIRKNGLGTKCLLLSGHYRGVFKNQLTGNDEFYSCANNTLYLKFSAILFVILGMILI